ncbi:crcB protein [Xenococcus sp. PCC 7305]|uniref:fluoride efflux transporter CrcB n=1 Tax=Xenococcus sp. PCC 7305 TaxID=102125 RepID=UPI0002ACD642|nr:fluoride efflux transporter CrcB [Xenococcus sp. PCC 7305]ELS05243.1 crcB protein [Xenococcus sp. PCC 7305]
MISIPIAISLGAILGALSRYYVTLFWIEKRGRAFPHGTLFVNITGAFLIGFMSILATRYDFPLAMQKLIIVGFFGSYTTFSSYILDSAILFRRHDNVTGFIYWLGSPVLGFIAIELGIWIARTMGS